MSRVVRVGCIPPLPLPLAQGEAASPANPLPGARQPRSPARLKAGGRQDLMSHFICKLSEATNFLWVIILRLSSFSLAKPFLLMAHHNFL